MAINHPQDVIRSALDRDYSALLTPGLWQRLFSRQHRLTPGQSFLVMMSHEMLIRCDYRSAIILLAECIDTPEGMEKRTARAVARMIAALESLCGLPASMDWILYAGYATTRLVAPVVAEAASLPSCKALALERLGPPRSR